MRITARITLLLSLGLVACSGASVSYDGTLTDSCACGDSTVKPGDANAACCVNQVCQATYNGGQPCPGTIGVGAIASSQSSGVNALTAAEAMNTNAGSLASNATNVDRTNQAADTAQMAQPGLSALTPQNSGTSPNSTATSPQTSGGGGVTSAGSGGSGGSGGGTSLTLTGTHPDSTIAGISTTPTIATDAPNSPNSATYSGGGGGRNPASAAADSANPLSGLAALFGGSGSKKLGSGADLSGDLGFNSGQLGSKTSTVNSLDPEDYFSRSKSDDDLFKIVERRYTQKQVIWIRQGLK